jgi:mono/diheme cytochrome c family protein
MLKPVLLFSAVALLVIAPLMAPAAAQDAAPQKVPAKVTVETQAKAKNLYARDCALCHGATGDGKSDLAKDMQLNMVDYTDPKTLATIQDQDLFKIIRNGKDKMPAEETSRAKDEEVWNLVVYIRSLSKNQPAAAPAAVPAAAPAAAPAATPAPSH